jgi:hypothetical protein
MAKVIATASSRKCNPYQVWLKVRKIWEKEGLDSAISEMSQLMGTQDKLHLTNQLFSLTLKYS